MMATLVNSVSLSIALVATIVGFVRPRRTRTTATEHKGTEFKALGPAGHTT